MASDGPPRRLSDFAAAPWTKAQVLVGSLLVNVLALAMPLALLQVYDRILPSRSLSTATVLLSAVVVAILAEMLLRTARSYLMGQIGARFEHGAGTTAMARLLSSDLAAFERHGTGVHLERLNAVGTLRDFYSGQAIMALFDLPFSVIYFLLIAYLGNEIVAIPLIILAAFLVLAGVAGIRLRRSLDDHASAEDERFNFMLSVLGGIHTVKTMAMEAPLMRRYEALQERRSEMSRRVDRYGQIMSEAGGTLSQVCVLAVAGYGSTLVLDGELTVGGLSACSLLAGRALQPLQNAVGFWSRFQSINLARRQLGDVFDLPLDALSARDDADYHPATIQGAISLKGVHFRFADDQPDILRGIDLEIAPGDMVGIVGSNGSGKTILLSLIRGLTRPSTGTVLLDGRPLSAYDPAILKRQVAYLPQRELLFRGTILDNLTMFRPDLEAQAMEAADTVRVAETVIALPQGFRTMVGDGAYEALPRGLAQRIAIARALVDRPRVLLFDEANTAIDITGDEGVKTALAGLKGHCTVILVSHRPSILKLADRVHTLGDGLLDDGLATGTG